MFSRRLWLSGSRAGGTRQSGSPGRGPQDASQAPCSARTASRSRHRSSGVTQCGGVGVPPVTASSAAANRRADGEAPPTCTIVHASRIASSISRSVTFMVTCEMSLKAPAYSEDQGARREMWGKHTTKVFRREADSMRQGSTAVPRPQDRSRCHQFANGGGGNTEVFGHPRRAEPCPNGGTDHAGLRGWDVRQRCSVADGPCRQWMSRLGHRNWYWAAGG